MTTIYFVHSEGKEEILKEFLEDKKIEIAYSSPSTSAIQLIREFANDYRLPIHLVDELGDLIVGRENLEDVQERMIDVLQMFANEQADKTILVSSNVIAIGSVIQYFDESFNHAEYQRVARVSPWIMKFVLDGEVCIEIEEIRIAG